MRFVPVETADEYILSNCNVQKVVKVGPSYRYTYGRKQEMTFKKYKELAIAQNRNPDNLTYSQIEDLFWKNVEHPPERKHSNIRHRQRIVPFSTELEVLESERNHR